MNRLRVTTPWKGDGLTVQTAYRPAVADDHPVASWVDQTGADPRLGGTYTVEVLCDDATMTAIQNDPKYSDKVVVQ
jgi:hypothetical protein